MDLKQKLLDDVAAEAEAKRQAIEANTLRILQLEGICERLNAACPGAGFSPIAMVCNFTSGSASGTSKVRCWAITHKLGLTETLQAITAAGLVAGEVVETYPDEPAAPWRHHRSIVIDPESGITVECALSEKEQQAALCA